MVKLPVSDKKSSYGMKPHIKKAYYPAKLLSVEPFKDKAGNLKEGKYGHQLIFQFAIFKPNPETNAPSEPMIYNTEEGSDIETPVIISKWVYYEYKSNKEGQPEFQTAITPNSAITKLLKTLGWTFSADGDVDPEDFVGNWVEVDVGDYEYKDDEGNLIKASTISGVHEYEGPKVSDKIKDVKKSENKKVSKQVKHSSLSEDNAKKIAEFKDLNKKGLLTNEGLKQVLEQLEN
ncbi:MAG TPA: hypothetical protein ENI61_05790 [Ignavibacteria bacterium]|nr:hypothetical protein [Ignavibacteria bacterium]